MSEPLQIRSLMELRKVLKPLRSQGKSIAFVPTMGYLHAGHLSLVEIAQQRADVVVVSIFVNPAQFNEQADFAAYPVDLDHDISLLSEQGVDIVFLPELAEVYGTDFQTWIEVEKLSLPHEGEFRPGHYRGVTTVVNILFNMVAPDLAVFGEKDFQQLRLIEQMTADLKLPIEIIAAPLVREGDGLAMSSRNVRLTSAQRESALVLSRALFAARELWQAGEREPSKLLETMKLLIAGQPDLNLEYLRVVDPQSLEQISRPADSMRIILAARVGAVRLIDTIGLS